MSASMLANGRTFLRLYFQKHGRCYAGVINNVTPSEIKHSNADEVAQEEEILHKKILYNTYLESVDKVYGNRSNIVAKIKAMVKNQKELQERARTVPIPISLKYFLDEKQLSELQKDKKCEEPLPVKESGEFPFEQSADSKVIDEQNIPETWMTDYDYFDDASLKMVSKEHILNLSGNTFDFHDVDELEYQERLIEHQNMLKKYGTADPDIPVSNVKCGGCGSLLHCKDSSIPGYLPSEIFLGRTVQQLRELHCQRCHFLKEYNVALNVVSPPEEYPLLLKEIKHKFALVILMVDLLDFPCSIWPGIIDIIGVKRPVIVVGNKVDLLPEDSRGYLKNIRDTLKKYVDESSLGKANIKHISLISAKTGYGVEDLITKLHVTWGYRGDVYLIGCTNVGKSSLFNALLQSDYCKTEAIDLLQRATISPWPGTTLNLLNFPILRPAGWRTFIRNRRLSMQKADRVAENKHRQLLSIETNNPKYATLIGHIGTTFLNTTKIKTETSDMYSYTSQTGFTQANHPKGVSDTSDMYKESKWCYDTPGVVHPDQILSILTIEELMSTLPKQLIRPQSLKLSPGTTVFVAGLARLDIVDCQSDALVTVFASHHLPLTVCKTSDAEELYAKLIGTEYFGVPRGNEERMAKWPHLKCFDSDFEITGDGLKRAVADVVLSSAGWISVAVESEHTCTVKAWTPEARGIHLREPSILQFACVAKGKKIQGTPAYTIGRVYYKGKRVDQ